MQLLYPLEFRNQLEVRLDSQFLGMGHSDEWCDIYKLENLSHMDQSNLLISLGDFFEFMPTISSLPKGEIKNDILKHTIKKSVTFFGGSFFPFHEGHMSCLRLCPEKNIVVIPDCNPEKKNEEKVNPYISFLDLCQRLKETSHSIYPGFLGRNKKNPTAHWLPEVKIEEKKFLMGDDSFMNLLNWQDASTLIKALAQIYIVPRIYNELDCKKQMLKIKEINANLEMTLLPDHAYKNLSSSILRRS